MNNDSQGPKVDRGPRKSPLDILEKIVLPIAVAILAYYGKQASDQISASQISVARQQVEVARLQLERQKTEADSNLQLKYIELFYHDIQDADPKRKQGSIALLSAMQPTVAQVVSRAIVSDPATPLAVRQQVAVALVNSRRFGPLINYTLVVYYPASSAADARALLDGLVRLGFSRDGIELRERPHTFIDDAAKFGYHIRYDDVYENEAADYLARNLSEILPGKVFTKVRVTGSRTDGVLTIFLFK